MRQPASIGVTAKSVPAIGSPVDVAYSYSASNYSAYFFSDNSSYMIKNSAINEVQLAVAPVIGTLAIVGSGIADELENVMVLRNIGAGIDLKQSAIDQMLLAGSVKWGLLVTAIVLFLALAGNRWLESRRA